MLEIQSCMARTAKSESGLSKEIDSWKSKLKKAKEELAKVQVQLFIEQQGKRMVRLTSIIETLLTETKQQVNQILQRDKNQYPSNINAISFTPSQKE